MRIALDMRVYTVMQGIPCKGMKNTSSSSLTRLEPGLTRREEPFLQREQFFLAHPIRLRLCPCSLLG